jgi:hypothetical protein
MKKSKTVFRLSKLVFTVTDDIQIGWKSSSFEWKVGSDMSQNKNTCYLNSTLQAIFHVPSAVNGKLVDIGHKESENVRK